MIERLIRLLDPARRDLAPARVLSGAEEADLVNVVVIGRDAVGDLYFASSEGDSAVALWLMEHAKAELLKRSRPDLAP